MQFNEDEDCLGKDLSSKLQIDVSFQEFLHVKKNMIACVIVGLYAIHYMECVVLANFRISPEIYFCM